VKNWQLAPWRIRAASMLGAQLAAPFLGAFLCALIFSITPKVVGNRPGMKKQATRPSMEKQGAQFLFYM
jgi:hypothetical protein